MPWQGEISAIKKGSIVLCSCHKPPVVALHGLVAHLCCCPEGGAYLILIYLHTGERSPYNWWDESWSHFLRHLSASVFRWVPDVCVRLILSYRKWRSCAGESSQICEVRVPHKFCQKTRKGWNVQTDFIFCFIYFCNWNVCTWSRVCSLFLTFPKCPRFSLCLS